MTALNPFAVIGTILQTLTPKIVLNAIEPWLDKVRGLLQGETLRAIGYGAGVIVYLVAKFSGKIPDVPFDQAIIQAGGAAALVITVLETIRKYVFSPATVAAIVATPPTAAGPVVAAVEAGVPPELIADAAPAPIEELDEAAVQARLDKVAAAGEPDDSGVG